MATKVKNNLGAVRTLNTLGKNSRASQKDLRKISTGEKITSAADDASAYGISERMREKIRSLDQANQNTQNDLAMMKTAEGAVANIVDVLRTLKQKAIDSANDSNTDEDRRVMQKEVDQLIDQIDDNALVTFNGKFLVNGNMSGLTKMVGAVWICEGLFYPGVYKGAVYHDDQLLTDLRDRDGRSLGIENGDTFTLSCVTNGKTYTYSDTVDGYRLGYVLNGQNNAGTYPTPGDRNTDIGATTSIIHETISQYEVVGSSYGDMFLSDYVTIVPHPDGINGAVADKDGKPLKVPEGVLSIASKLKDYQLSGISLIIRDGGGNIKENATRALKFRCIQRGEGPSDGDGGGYLLQQPFTSERVPISQ